MTLTVTYRIFDDGILRPDPTPPIYRRVSDLRDNGDGTYAAEIEVPEA